MDYAKLRELIDTHCDGMTDEECVAHLNDKTLGVSVRTTWAGERTLYAQLGPAVAEPILQALEAAGAADPVVKRALKWLAPPSEGIDLGDAYTRDMIDALVVATVLTAEQAAALKGIAETPASLCEVAGLGRCHVGDVQNARLVEVTNG
jgi:hypothetical protein